MADCSAATSQQAAEVNSLNSKLAYDFSAQLQNQALIDSQAHARTLRLLEVQAMVDAQTVKQLALTATLTETQTGQTEDQNLNKPTPNLVADDVTAAAGGAESVALGESALNSVTEQLGELVAQVTALAAIVTTLAQNQVNAATPKGA